MSTINIKTDEYITRVANLKSILLQLDPNTVLTRGYALVRGVIKVNSVIEIETNKVIIKAEVKNVVNK